MSQWRKEASARLPELQKIIADPIVDSPMMLWVELNMKYGGLCSESPLPLDLLRRIWSYGFWCLDHPNQDVSTAAALAFFQHILHTQNQIDVLHQLTSRKTLEELRSLLAYHNSPEKIDSVFATLKQQETESNHAFQRIAKIRDR